MHIDDGTIHTLSLNTSTESVIENINLYSGQAQITRVYKAKVSAGQTKITVSHLPNVVDHSSVRVEGRGDAVIKGVAAFKASNIINTVTSPSPQLAELSQGRSLLQKEKERAVKARDVIDSYMKNITVEHLDVSKLGQAMEVYDTTYAKWESKVLLLDEQLRVLEEKIKTERDKFKTGDIPIKLRTMVVIDLFTESESDLDIILTYVVSSARWDAEYDTRVDLKGPKAPVKLIYKAKVQQNTAENWNDAPIALETARPTFGVNVPVLHPWNISYQEPPRQAVVTSGSEQLATQYSYQAARATSAMPMSALSTRAYRNTVVDDNDLSFVREISRVGSHGHVNASFRVPGLTTIASDAEGQRVTIAELELESKISWLCIPRVNSNVHLEARITNSSEYTCMAGPNHIYVDGVYISRSQFPDASPKEVFTCALGVDPSIRVTYHPRTTLVSETGFYTKSKKHSFTQRITVHNTKSVAVEGVKIRDNIPVSQDANLIVKLISPPLTLTSTLASPSSVPSVQVGDGITASWAITDEMTGSAVGKDGMLQWVCTIPALGKVNLLLEWEVTSNPKSTIVGLV